MSGVLARAFPGWDEAPELTPDEVRGPVAVPAPGAGSAAARGGRERCVVAGDVRGVVRVSVAPLRTVSILSVTGGVCGIAGCDEPPTTEVVIDDGKALRTCERHWLASFHAAYNLTSPLRRKVPR